MNPRKNAIRGGVLRNASKKKRLVIGILGVSLVTSIGMLSLNYFGKYENPIEKESNKQIAMYIEGDSGYEISSSNVFPTEGYVLNLEKSRCKNGGILSQDPTTKALSLLASSQDSCTVYFDKEKTPAEKTLASLKVTSNGVRTDFDDPATTDEGIFEMEDDYGTSYYYRGAVTNNYVKFAGFYWRIIRVNGDGSLRIIYDGTTPHANGESNNDSSRFIKTNQAYNTNYNDAKYVGWMYGPSGTKASTSKEQAQTNTESSDIKKAVDEWYKTYIVDAGYSGAVADILFCNDRSTPGPSNTGWSNDTGLGYGTKATAYGAVARMGPYSNSSVPTFKCPQKNDAFTVEDMTKGNGALDYPVGLITADEIVAAGSGKYNTWNNSYYLYRANKYWSLSPYNFNSSNARIFTVADPLNNIFVYENRGMNVAPVINLSAKNASALIGTGIMTDPFRASDVTP